MRKILLMLFLLALAACSNYADPNDVTVTAAEMPAADEIKLIDKSITAPMEPGTFKSEEYHLSQDSRLLIRLGKLKTLATEVLNEQPVLVRVAPLAGQLEMGRQNFKLCPMTNNWMMYATWKRAHTFKKGEWKTEGGDFERADCLTPMAANDPIFDRTDEGFFCSATEVLCFDVKGHLKNYVRARGVNYGWVLLNESNDVISVHGDESSLAPAVFYRRLRN